MTTATALAGQIVTTGASVTLMSSAAVGVQSVQGADDDGADLRVVATLGPTVVVGLPVA